MRNGNDETSGECAIRLHTKMRFLYPFFSDADIERAAELSGISIDTPTAKQFNLAFAELLQFVPDDPPSKHRQWAIRVEKKSRELLTLLDEDPDKVGKAINASNRFLGGHGWLYSDYMQGNLAEAMRRVGGHEEFENPDLFIIWKRTISGVHVIQHLASRYASFQESAKRGPSQDEDEFASNLHRAFSAVSGSIPKVTTDPISGKRGGAALTFIRHLCALCLKRVDKDFEGIAESEAADIRRYLDRHGDRVSRVKTVLEKWANPDDQSLPERLLNIARINRERLAKNTQVADKKRKKAKSAT